MGNARVFVPIRDFAGFTRLRPQLDAPSRRSLVLRLAELLVASARAEGLGPSVVTADSDVISWCADSSIPVIRDPGRGLDTAAVAAAEAAGNDRWLIAHADLPLVTAGALGAVAEHPGTVLVPSLDGGTNVIAGHGAFPFSYGPGSFHRHLAASPEARVLPSRELSVDIDTPRQLEAAMRLAPTLAEP